MEYSHSSKIRVRFQGEVDKDNLILIHKNIYYRRVQKNNISFLPQTFEKNSKML